MTEPEITEARAAVLRRTVTLGAAVARTMGAVQMADIFTVTVVCEVMKPECGRAR